MNALNDEILMRIQERGLAMPSATTIGGKFVMRAALVNHRTRFEDMDFLAETVRAIGAEVLADGT